MTAILQQADKTRKTILTMKSSSNAANINQEAIRTHLSSYETFIPTSLQGLEKFRLDEVPETLAQRKKDGDAFLDKTEVITLVEWKL